MDDPTPAPASAAREVADRLWHAAMHDYRLGSSVGYVFEHAVEKELAELRVARLGELFSGDTQRLVNEVNAERQRAQAAEAERDKLHTELIHVAAKLMRGQFVLNLDGAKNIIAARKRAELQREQHADEARYIDNTVKELERLRKEAK